MIVDLFYSDASPSQVLQQEALNISANDGGLSVTYVSDSNNDNVPHEVSSKEQCHWTCLFTNKL